MRWVPRHRQTPTRIPRHKGTAGWPLTAPYACPSKDDLREITRHRTDLLEVKMVSDLRAYYLIRGVIIQVVQEDPASGTSEVRLPGGFKTFWTLTRFLSRSPIRDTWGVVETPTTSSMMLQGQTCSASCYFRDFSQIGSDGFLTFFPAGSCEAGS